MGIETLMRDLEQKLGRLESDQRELCEDRKHLMDVYRSQYAPAQVFEVGQLVKLKPNTGNIVRCADKSKPLILVEHLKPFQSEEVSNTSCVAPIIFDCLVGAFDSDDGEFVIFPSSLNGFEKLTDQDKEDPTQEGYGLALTEVLEAYNKPGDLVEGELLTWKHPALSKNFQVPGKFAVCVQLGLEGERPDKVEKSIDPKYYVNFDMVFGVVSNGEWELYYGDSRRFKRVAGADS